MILFGLCPDAGWLAFAEEFHVDQVGVAANRAILHVLLLVSLGQIKGDDNSLAARRTGV